MRWGEAECKGDKRSEWDEMKDEIGQGQRDESGVNKERNQRWHENEKRKERKRKERIKDENRLRVGATYGLRDPFLCDPFPSLLELDGIRRSLGT